MIDSVLTLLTSKRVIVAIVALAIDIALIFGVDLDPEKLTTLITAVSTLAVVLIGGISVSDHGKAMGQPAGIDHKGRVDDAYPEDEGEESDEDEGGA